MESTIESAMIYEINPIYISLIHFCLIVGAVYIAIYYCNTKCEPKPMFAHIIVSILCPICYIIYGLIKCF